MTYLSLRFFRIVAIFLGILVLFLLGEIDSLAYRAAEFLFEGAGFVVVLCLLAVEGAGLVYLYRAFFSRPSKLVLKRGASEEERREFAKELKARLVRNPHLKNSGISRDDPDFLTKAIAHLDSVADEEIRSNGKKVFLGTALSQNGRLDALIVFISLCRMVWRVSGIYNQKPTAEEIWSVCSTVSSSTFVAFSIEALDIPQMITDTMNEMVPSIAPAVAASSVPFVGSCLNVFTESVIDGAANCLLAVRAGIITRRAYSYAIYGGSESLRSLCVKETARMLLDITQESVVYVAKALKKEMQDVSIGTGKKLVQKTADGVRTTVRAAGDATGMAAAAVGKSASYVAQGTGLIADGVRQVAGEATEKAVSAVRGGAGFLADGAGLIADGLGSAAGQVQGVLADGVHHAASVLHLPGAKKTSPALSETEPSRPKENLDQNPDQNPGESPDQSPGETPGEKLGENSGENSVAAPQKSTVFNQAKGAAGRAVSYVAEGTTLLVGGVGSVAQAVGSDVKEKGKKIAGFLKDKKEGIRTLFK